MNQIGKAKAIYSKLTTQWSQLPFLAFWQRLKGSRGVGKLYSGQKGYALIESCWLGEAVGRPTRSRMSYVIG